MNKKESLRGNLRTSVGYRSILDLEEGTSGLRRMLSNLKTTNLSSNRIEDSRSSSSIF